MNTPGKRSLRFRERLLTAFLKAVFPRVSPAEIMLFFCILLMHALSYLPAILPAFGANIRRDFIRYVLNADDLLEYANAVFSFFLPGLFCLWAAIVVPLAALLLLAFVLSMGFAQSSDMAESPSARAARYDKAMNASFIMYYYLAFAIASGYLLYLYIEVRGLFPSAALLDHINYLVLWLFFIRQIACGLVVFFGRPDESSWGQNFLDARLRKQGYHWLALVIGLAAAVMHYTLLRQKYHVPISAVVFTFIYSYILLNILDRIISKIPVLAELAPPALSLQRLPFFKNRLFDPADRETRSRKLKDYNIKKNARCPACGAQWHIDETANLEGGAFVPCPRCKARLMPLPPHD